MELSRGSMGYGILLVLFVLFTVTSAQITFSRQWVRGKYPGDNEGGESPEFQRAAKAVYPKRTSYSRFVRPSEYVPILVNAHILEEILDRVKEPSIGLAAPNVPMDSSRNRKIRMTPELVDGIALEKDDKGLDEE